MPWRQDPAASGGLAFSEAIAMLDVMIDVIGPVRQVFTWANTSVTARPIEDVMSVALLFDSGALGTLSVTTAAAKAYAEDRLAVVGTHGSAVIGPALQSIESWRIDGDDEDAVRQKMMDLPARTSWQSNWDALHDFVEALAEGIEPTLTARQSIGTIATAEAMVQSAAEGRMVAVSEDTVLPRN
jgi:predicted dehydrogenase